MRKKSKSHRKATHRRMGEIPSNNKENSFSNVFCSKGEIRDFRTKTTEPVTRGSHFETSSVVKNMVKSGADHDRMTCSNSRQAKRSRRKRNNKSPNFEWYEDNGSLMFPTSKYSSIAFFIPLRTTTVTENALNKTFDWNGLLFYESNTSALLSRYQFEQEKKKQLCDHNFFVPESKQKCRSSSESSANSEDSVVFTNDDVDFDDEDCTCDTTNSLIVEHDHEGTDEPDCKPSCSEDNSTQKRVKKVRFVDNSELVTVHVIVAWNYAYRAARISQWEVVARDSNRFKSKILSLESIISPVLQPEHRRKIWETRMSKSELSEKEKK